MYKRIANKFARNESLMSVFLSGILFANNQLPPVLSRFLKAYVSTRPLAIRSCPICGYKGYFKIFGTPPRIDAECRRCASLERHRLFWIAWSKDVLFKKSDINLEILHFAPEEVLSEKLRNQYKFYKTADLYSHADIRLDIENIDLDDSSIDVVIVNHVFEHVDDLKATNEIFRILRPQGRLIAMIPIVEGWNKTYVNSSIEDTHQRLIHFGQADHVRFFGSDFRTRIGYSGLKLTAEYTAEGSAVIDYGLVRGEKVFIFEKL